MTAVLRHTAAVSQPLTRSGMTVVRVSSQCPYDVIPVLDTGMALLHR
ncbi:hypothetical protein [Wolbachia endosymbiont (group A) of Gastracanthus pulcherrimus]